MSKPGSDVFAAFPTLMGNLLAYVHPERGARSWAAWLNLVLGVLLGLVVGTAHAQTINEYAVPTASSGPLSIIAGTDGNLWFTENNGNKIGRITPAGVVTAEYSVPTASSYPTGITKDLTGKMWFTENYGNKIGSITTTGAPVEFTGLPASTGPLNITVGADGNLWFTVTYSPQIWRINRITGALTPFYVDITGSEALAGITKGPGADSNLYFTDAFYGQIGRLDPTTTVFDYCPVPPAGTVPAIPRNIVAGPDGNLWFTDAGNSRIGRISPASFPSACAFTFFSAGISGTTEGITVGPDNNLWFTENYANKIGRITTAGAVAEYNVPTASSEPTGITAGPDGNIWFTEYSANKIGRLTLAAGPTAPTATTGAASALTATGATLNGTVSAGGALTAVVFQYGLTTSYGSTATATQSPLAPGAVNAAVSASVTGLTCNTVYHVRVTATNSVTTTSGSDQTFTTAACSPTVIGNNPVGSGTITATTSGCGTTCVFTKGAYIPVSGDPRSPPVPPPAGYVFPYGLFDFVVSGFTAGSTVTITLVYPASLPAGTVYAKYGPTPGNTVPHWYELPATINANTVILTITDGGLGDDDLIANGSIVDQGGPAFPGGDVAIPTLSQYGLLLLVGIMSALGIAITRRSRLI